MSICDENEDENERGQRIDEEDGIVGLEGEVEEKEKNMAVAVGVCVLGSEDDDDRIPTPSPSPPSAEEVEEEKERDTCKMEQINCHLQIGLENKKEDRQKVVNTMIIDGNTFQMSEDNNVGIAQAIFNTNQDASSFIGLAPQFPQSSSHFLDSANEAVDDRVIIKGRILNILENSCCTPQNMYSIHAQLTICNAMKEKGFGKTEGDTFDSEDGVKAYEMSMIEECLEDLVKAGRINKLDLRDHAKDWYRDIAKSGGGKYLPLVWIQPLESISINLTVNQPPITAIPSQVRIDEYRQYFPTGSHILHTPAIPTKSSEKSLTAKSKLATLPMLSSNKSLAKQVVSQSQMACVEDMEVIQLRSLIKTKEGELEKLQRAGMGTNTGADKKGTERVQLLSVKWTRAGQDVLRHLLQRFTAQGSCVHVDMESMLRSYGIEPDRVGWNSEEQDFDHIPDTFLYTPH